MTQLAKVATCVLTLGIMAVPAAADPIQITEGSLAGRFFVDLEMRSADGSFSVSGSSDSVAGLFGPAQCRPCAPGLLMSLTSRWIRPDFRGEATIDGTTYPFPRGDMGPGLNLEFLGSWVAPAFVGDTMVSVTNPFTFTGTFFYAQDATTPGGREDLFGHGLATVSVNWNAGAAAWELARAEYTFSSDPIPEPASMLLLGTGLAMMGRTLRRSRSCRRPEASV